MIMASTSRKTRNDLSEYAQIWLESRTLISWTSKIERSLIRRSSTTCLKINLRGPRSQPHNWSFMLLTFRISLVNSDTVPRNKYQKECIFSSRQNSVRSRSNFPLFYKLCRMDFSRVISKRLTKLTMWCVVIGPNRFEFFTLSHCHCQTICNMSSMIIVFRLICSTYDLI